MPDGGYSVVMDDGSTVVFGADGYPVETVMRDGSVVPVDTSIVGDLQKLFTGTIAGAIRSAFAVKPATPTAAAAAAVQSPALSLQKYLPVALLVILGIVAYKKLLA